MSGSKQEQLVFVALAFCMWAVNIWMVRQQYPFFSDLGATAFGGTLVSIPIWSVIGYILAGFYLFFHNLIYPEKRNLTIWQKADLGLLVGIIIKLWFGIAL